MVRIRQPFFSIATAFVFSALAVMYGLNAATGVSVFIGSVEFNAAASWALTGVMFLMAYFALVHIRDK
jgi:hypothetical protein